MLFRRDNLLPGALTPKRDTSNAQNELKKEVDIGMSDK
jgi:hypothetical protein